MSLKYQRLNTVLKELRRHAPFTGFGTLSGVLVLTLLMWTEASRSVSVTLFWTLHPLHVFLSALVTTAMFRLHGGQGFWATVGIGYLGSIGIATLSDCILPFVGEWLLALPHRGLHLGFIEKWWLVNPLAIGGIVAGFTWPHTKFPHAGHVLLSTWASLFHITMALGTKISLPDGMLIALFLFLSVWLPCCTSDIVFPLLFAPEQSRSGRSGKHHWRHITGLRGWDRARRGMPAFGAADCSHRWKSGLPRRIAVALNRRRGPREDHPSVAPASPVTHDSNDEKRQHP